LVHNNDIFVDEKLAAKLEDRRKLIPIPSTLDLHVDEDTKTSISFNDSSRLSDNEDDQFNSIMVALMKSKSLFFQVSQEDSFSEVQTIL